MRYQDRSGLLAAVSHAISSEGSNIISCSLQTDDGGAGTVAMSIEVRDAAHLNRIVQKLEAVDGMLQVERRGFFTRVGL